MTNGHRSGRLPAGAALLWILAFFASIAGAQQPVDTEQDPSARGRTGPTLIRAGLADEVSDPPPGVSDYPPFQVEPLALYPELSVRDSNWVLVDVDTFRTYLRAGEAGVLHYDHLAGTLAVIEPPSSLVDRARQAMDYAPSWLSLDLRDAFTRMDSTHQETYAQIILDTDDPIVDEVAFVVAHTATSVLESGNFYCELLTENAEDVYAHDPFLNYVDIVDYGSAALGGDYYSTVQYRTAATRDTNQVEMPRERYYWDIVHLKITDEFPQYIDPATGSAADPPLGRFWREFLFAHSDSGYPLLRDALAGCETLWEGAVDTRTNGAVGILTQWILDVMDFGSGAERPIQPVRIYRKHLGRCGEHADITAAAARAALIATTSATAIPDDHTWNEFWDRRWVAWEPVNVYVDSPWHYEGWGKSFIGIFDWRGDDFVWTTTHNGYTPHCTLTVAVSDSFGYPLDGAQVTIGKKLDVQIFQEVTWASTDCNGLCQFTLGDDHDIFYRIDSDLGTVPPGPLFRMAVDDPLPDQHYLWEKSIENHRPQIPVQPAALPPSRQDEYQLRVTWDGVREYVYGQNRIDDRWFSDPLTEGRVEFFICDQANYTSYAASDTFFGYAIMEDASSAEVTFTFPTDDDWYAVLSNEEHVVNSQVIRGTAELYRRSTAGVARDDSRVSVGPELGRIYPNPFTPHTWISYSIGAPGSVDLAVYDVTGRLVTRLVSKSVSAGDHRVRWDGTDRHGTRVAAGVYVCVLETQQSRVCRKMVVVR